VLHAATVLDFPAFGAASIKHIEGLFSPHVWDVPSACIGSSMAMEVVLLGQTYDLPDIMKRAYYELLRSSGQSITDQSQQLSAKDQHRIATVRAKLAHFWVDCAVSHPSDFVCSSEVKCKAETDGQTIHYKLVLASGLFKKFIHDPIGGLRVLMRVGWEDEGFCTICVNRKVAMCHSARNELWCQLDGWLGNTE
jgi:hypothetical protein